MSKNSIILPPNSTGAEPLAVEARELTRSFGDFTAVNQLNLQVRQGMFLGFLGPNGAGKSTTIKMLTGLLRPSSGKVLILGRDLEQEPVAVKRQIGVVPEDLNLFERLSGREFLTFVGRMYGLSADIIAQRSAELFEALNLAEQADRQIVDYSYGMKKKLSFSAALMHQPRLLFLDEPFEGIDAVTSQTIRAILRHLTRNNVTIFLTSHILEIVEKLCDHIVIIHRGNIVSSGSLAELQAGVRREDGRIATLEELFLDVLGQSSENQTALSWLT